jgi:hypothetical protein
MASSGHPLLPQVSRYDLGKEFDANGKPKSVVPSTRVSSYERVTGMDGDEKRASGSEGRRRGRTEMCSSVPQQARAYNVGAMFTRIKFMMESRCNLRILIGHVLDIS